METTTTEDPLAPPPTVTPATKPDRNARRRKGAPRPRKSLDARIESLEQMLAKAKEAKKYRAIVKDPIIRRVVTAMRNLDFAAKRLKEGTELRRTCFQASQDLEAALQEQQNLDKPQQPPAQ